MPSDSDLAFDPSRDLPGCLAQLPCFVSVFDRCGVTLWCSRYGYGCTPESVIGQVSDVLIPERWRATWWTAFRRARDRREVAHYRLEINVPEPPKVIALAGRLLPVIVENDVRFVVALVFDAAVTPDCGECPALVRGTGLPAVDGAPQQLPPGHPPIGRMGQPTQVPQPPPGLAPSPPIQQTQPGQVPPGAMWLSPLGERVVAFLGTRTGQGWATGQEIAEALREPYNHRLKASLTALADRKILESSGGFGYRIARS